MSAHDPIEAPAAPQAAFPALDLPWKGRRMVQSSGLETAVAVNFALSAARVRAKTAQRETRAELRAAALTWRATHREQRENDLKEMGVVIPLSDWLGHNNGPDILESALFKEWRWRKAQEAAFAPPDAETGARWARKAAELGLSYREYRLELLERGRHPTDEDASRIRAARPRHT